MTYKTLGGELKQLRARFPKMEGQFLYRGALPSQPFNRVVFVFLLRSDWNRFVWFHWPVRRAEAKNIDGWKDWFREKGRAIFIDGVLEALAVRTGTQYRIHSLIGFYEAEPNALRPRKHRASVSSAKPGKARVSNQND
ncbi:MAG: hypothetical protein ACYCVY_13055 [Acidiferrobacteraceae bacterium]